MLALWPAKHTDATGASTQEACRRPHEEARGFSQSETMSWRGFSSRLASLGAEIEDSVAQEVNNLRAQLQKAESDRMETHLSYLRLEASLHDTMAQRADLESELRLAREENARLRQTLDDVDGRAVEAAQLTRINDLSRELIATRFELAKAAAAAASQGALTPSEGACASRVLTHPSPPPSTSALGLDALLSAAERLDLQAADAILNPACVFSMPSLQASDLVSAAGVARGGSGIGDDEEEADASSGADDNDDEDTDSEDARESAGERGRGRGGRRRARAEDSLGASLSRALLAVCLPKEAAPKAAAPNAAAAAAAGGSASGGAPKGAGSAEEAKRDGASSGEVGGSSLGTAADSTAPAVAAADGAPADAKEDVEEDAAREADATSALIEALLLRGAHAGASAPDATGRTPLHGVCARQLPTAAAILLQHGADANAADAEGRTPLHVAAAIGCGQLVELLLRHGGDETCKTASGQTAPSLAQAAPDKSACAVFNDASLRLSAMAKRASALYRNGSFREAADAFRAALGVASEGGASVCSTGDVATLHFNCARALLREGEHVSALENATAALACRPDYANAGMLQAECHMELLDFDAAAAAYRRVSALEPSNPAWTDCAARAAAMAAAPPYEVLGVSESADAAEIKRAYKRECLQWHPDKHQGSAEDRARANTMFRRVTNAYEVLSDARRRGELDAKRRAEAFHQHYQSAARAAGMAAGRAAAAAAPAQAAYDSFDAYSSFRTDQHPQSHHFYPPPSQAPSSYDYAAAHAARTAAREAAEAATYTSRRMDDRHSRRSRAPPSPRGVNLDEGGGQEQERNGGASSRPSRRGSVDDLLHEAFGLEDEGLPLPGGGYDETFDWRSRPTASASPWFETELDGP